MRHEIELHNCGDGVKVVISKVDIKVIHEIEGCTNIVLVNGDSFDVSETYDHVCGLL